MGFMKVVLATNNADKIGEFQSYLKGFHVEFFSLKDFPGVVLKEEATTLRENALQKARIAAQTTGLWALADDTGLFVEALNGKPGVFSSRYAGERATYSENVAKLLQEMEKIPGQERGAYFSCVMALVHADGREVVVEGRLEGSVTFQPKGQHGFGYDPIFYLPDRDSTLAELSLGEKNKISHRGRALFKVRGVLEGMIKMERR